MKNPRNPPPARAVTRAQVFVCGDLHNLGDLKLLLQNLALTEGRGGVVRRWGALPDAVIRQVERAGGEVVSGRHVLAFAARAFGREVVFGGGQLVRDNVSVPSLLGLLLAAWSARLGGGRFVTRGLGVSAIHSPLRRFLWRAILRNCALVNLRDDTSARNLARLLPDKPLAVNADMVFLQTAGFPAASAPVAQPRWVVVAPCVDGSEARSLEGEALEATLAAALAALPGARIAIACHDPRDCMDRPVAHRLAARWSEHDPAVFDSFDLSRLTDLYREAALVVTNRLHALIFAVLADAPVLAIEDGTAKVRVVADRFSIPVLSRHSPDGAEDQVGAALGFDRSHRARVRGDMACMAALNLA